MFLGKVVPEVVQPLVGRELATALDWARPIVGARLLAGSLLWLWLWLWLRLRLRLSVRLSVRLGLGLGLGPVLVLVLGPVVDGFWWWLLLLAHQLVQDGLLDGHGVHQWFIPKATHRPMSRHQLRAKQVSVFVTTCLLYSGSVV
jgi:hypothetical protein